jgi:hypothetical protein
MTAITIEPSVLLCENPIIIRYEGRQFELNLETEMKNVATKSRKYYTLENICNKIKSNEFKIDIKYCHSDYHHEAIENATITLNMDPTVKTSRPLKLKEVFKMKDVNIQRLDRYVKLENELVSKLTKEELLELVHTQNNYIQYLKYIKQRLTNDLIYYDPNNMSVDDYYYA